jgi:transcriptional regulator with XRE-family HTH domain
VDSTAGGQLADRLRDLRVRQELSLSEVARRARISKAYLSQLERGESTQPSYDVLVRLATALGATPQALAGADAPPAGIDDKFPAPLRAFAARTEIPDVDISMLSHIHYRGKQPATAEDWAHIYETITRTIR